MGANVHAGGVTFRVWAPFARTVAVAGDFNGWSGSASPLAAEGGGYWSADVPGAAEGSRYKFVLDGPAGLLWRKDPCAREVSNSGGDSIVRTEDFDGLARRTARRRGTSWSSTSCTSGRSTTTPATAAAGPATNRAALAASSPGSTTSWTAA
jgi:1,4-alpha-glucan branching enzyme